MEKYVYMFSEGNENMKPLLGGKGANLAGMTNIGLNVPPGFTITTQACNAYLKDKAITEEMRVQITHALKKLEKKTGKKFGDVENPLLLSIRSGARDSMPGMLETILNLGLNEKSVVGLIKLTKNPTFVYDIYRRFIMMYSSVAFNIDEAIFLEIIDKYKKTHKYDSDIDMDADDWRKISEKFIKIYEEHTGALFPEDPYEQLFQAINAVFRSWDNNKAKSYRKLNNIPYEWGTAVNVQSMVFGNTGDTSATGVLFSRNVANGVDELYGEYLVDAQGEDVVAGVRTPFEIHKLMHEDKFEGVYNQILEGAKKLENYFTDVQDMEVTIENGQLYFLQTRTAKRTAFAAIKIAMDLLDEGLIDKETAVKRISPKQIEMLMHPSFESKELEALTPLGKGLPASPGAAVGKAYFDANAALKAKESGEDVILVRQETSPEDIMGMDASEGILTVRGGMTSHAAVVARGMGKCCVCGCEEIILDTEHKTFTLGGCTFNEGDYVSLNGTTGEVYEGKLSLSFSEMPTEYYRFIQLVDEFRTIKVFANAETVRETTVAEQMGAEGIGLARTEHMFFEPDKIHHFRKMIIATNEKKKTDALAKIEFLQSIDFADIFNTIEGKKIIIRLLDPPLHEFLPQNEKEITLLAKELKTTNKEVKARIDSLNETNPMLGLRGCRLSIAYPEITKMQVRAIIKAFNNCKTKPELEIMIPLVVSAKEASFVKQLIIDEINTFENADEINYKIGCMIETPRAAILADELAKVMDFFSFGTNDLTQFTYAISRDDANEFMDSYLEKKIFDSDPTTIFDQEGTGKLVNIAIISARDENEDIDIGVCGEHAGEPSSIGFFVKAEVNYVSCSPYRIPVAKLAAAQASLK